MEEGLIDGEGAVVANDQSPEVGDPGDAAFHFPASLVASEFAAVLRRRFATIDLVWANQVDAPFFQPLTQGIRISRPIVNQAFGILARPSPARPGHGHPL